MIAMRWRRTRAEQKESLRIEANDFTHPITSCKCFLFVLYRITRFQKPDSGDHVCSIFPNSVFLDIPISCNPQMWIARKADFCISLPSATRPGRAATGRGRSMADSQTVDERATDGENKSLNFKVSADFKKDFKGFAVAQGMTMTDLLKEGFALTKKKRQK
jgi:hypothetical protein